MSITLFGACSLRAGGPNALSLAIPYLSQTSGKRISPCSTPGTIGMLPGQPRWLLVPGLVQCRAGPVWVEPCRLAHNPEVAGSNPAPATKPQATGPKMIFGPVCLVRVTDL